VPFDPRNNDPGGMGGYFVRQTGVSETPMIMPARDGYPTNSSSLGQNPIPPMPMLMGETTLGQQMGDNGTLYDIRYNLLNGANSRGVEGGYQWIPASAEQQVAARAAAMQDTYNQRTGANGGLMAAQQTAMDYQAGTQAGAIPAAPRFVIPPITASIGTAISPNIQNTPSNNPWDGVGSWFNGMLDQIKRDALPPGMYLKGEAPTSIEQIRALGGGVTGNVVVPDPYANVESSRQLPRPARANLPPPPVAMAPPVSVGALTDRTGYWGDSPYGNAIDSAGGAGVANPLLMRQAGMIAEEDGSFSPRMNAPVPMPVPVPAQVVIPAQPQSQPMPQPAMQARQFPFNQGGPALPPGFGANNAPTVIPNPATFGQDLRNRLRQQLPPVSRAQQLIDAQRKAMGR